MNGTLSGISSSTEKRRICLLCGVHQTNNYAFEKLQQTTHIVRETFFCESFPKFSLLSSTAASGNELLQFGRRTSTNFSILAKRSAVASMSMCCGAPHSSFPKMQGEETFRNRRDALFFIFEIAFQQSMRKSRSGKGSQSERSR